MRILTKPKTGTNMYLFLESMGFDVWWDRPGVIHLKDEDSEDRMEFVKELAKEYRKTDWVPYHLTVVPSHKGKQVISPTVSFVGKASQIVELKSALAGFRIVYFESEDNNYLWKCYGNHIEFSTEHRKISGRMVCTLRKGKQLINLLSHVRMSEVKS